MILNKIFSNLGSSAVKKAGNSDADKYKDLQKTNNDLLKQSMNGLGQEALANTAKGSFQAMQNLQELNRQLQEQMRKNQQNNEN